MKNLVIVESPTKAKTISKFLGKEYQVESSFGHMRDLPSKKMGIDIENNFEPTYEILPDSKEKVQALKKLAKNAETIYYATDGDREGEAIAWHLNEILKPEKEKTKRIVFHEITKNAILDSLKKARAINADLVDSQQARRVLDRLVGYELSPVLWKKVQIGLSAGRVQSVAVRIIVEREREINEFTGSSTFKVTAELKTKDENIVYAVLKDNFKTQAEAKKFLEEVSSADFTVENLEKKPGKRTPAAPFTTSTLQQEASRKLGFSARQTMMIAQKLYEQGKITYMRTDSVNLAQSALEAAAQEIRSNYGKEYADQHQYTTKSANAQEAHEAIRPTDFSVRELKGDSGQSRLYELIWKRTVASQMSDAKLEKTIVKIAVSSRDEKLTAEGQVILFDGFLKLYLEDSDDDEEEKAEEKILPALEKGQSLTLDKMTAKQTFKRPPARYTEASLVKKLEELGIGRPSTYAPTISTIQNRKYVEKTDKEGVERKYSLLTLQAGKISEYVETEITGAEKKKLFPTDVGSVVNDFLVKYFPEIVDFDFTAKVEAEFDGIAEGKEKWKKMISDFYGPFHKTIEKSEDVTRAEASQARELGKHPKTGKMVYAKIGRYGAMLQMGVTEDEEKPKFASMPKNAKLDTITLNEALPMFDLPRMVGKDSEGNTIEANVGRFGPYLKVGKLYVSITENELFAIELDEALEKIQEKKEKEANKNIRIFEKEGIKVLNGRYGPYVTDGKKNAKIPKETDPKKLTLEECKEMLSKTPIRGRRRFSKK